MKNKNELQNLCNVARQHIISMIHKAGSGHPGGSLSGVELLVCLYENIMNHKPDEPEWPDRDRFILSKGHVTPLIYSVLSSAGYFDPEELMTFRQFGSRLQGHPHKSKLPGLDSSSGSLGQGLSIANGLALSSRMREKPYRVYCMMGDGELQEGQIWEAAMTSAQHKLDNICAIVDYNKVQLDGTLEEIKSMHPMVDKWKSFNWNVIEIDGHDIEEILGAFEEAQTVKGVPTVIVANTVKGKGISFMENEAAWHGQAPDEEAYKRACAELEICL